MEERALLESVEKKIEYTFKNKKLLLESLIHKSYSNENKEVKGVNNEKLELLGDSVLSLIVLEYLYFKFPLMSEGDLVKIKSAIVSEPILAEFAIKIKMGEFILLSKGEELNGGRNRTSILGDSFEALLGAIYLDSTVKSAKLFLLKFLEPKLEEIQQNRNIFDYKTVFQEYAQKEFKQVPEYEISFESGPDHDKIFEISLKVNSVVISKGKGRNKKEAEQMAAKMACEIMGVYITDLF